MTNAEFNSQGRLASPLTLGLHDFGDGTFGAKSIIANPLESLAHLARPWHATVVCDDDFRHGAQGWVQLMADYPSGILTLDSKIAANGSGYSLKCSTGDYSNTGKPFGSCMAIKRMGRSDGFKKAYLGMLFSYGSLQSPPSTAERSPRCLEFGIDQADNAGDRAYFKVRWHNWQYISSAADAGTMQAGSTSTTAKLRSAASSVNDAYKGLFIVITGGTGVVGEARQIAAYNGTTKVATLTAPWTTIPDATTTYTLTNGTNGETVASRVQRLEVYDSNLKTYVPVRKADGSLATRNLGWNENKRNLHFIEVLVDLDAKAYDAVRLDGIGYGRWDATTNDSLRSFSPDPSTLLPFGNGFNATFEVRNRTETNSASAWGNLARAILVGYSS